VTIVPFDVPIIDDDVFEDVENVTLAIDPTSLPNQVVRGNVVQTTVSIVDNDGKLFLLLCVVLCAS